MPPWGGGGENIPSEGGWGNGRGNDSNLGKRKCYLSKNRRRLGVEVFLWDRHYETIYLRLKGEKTPGKRIIEGCPKQGRLKGGKPGDTCEKTKVFEEELRKKGC